MMDERRQHPRLQADLKALCKPWPPGDKKAPAPISFSSKTQDLSHGGISIITDYSLEVGGRLNLVLSFDSASQYLEMTGEVAWTKEVDGMTVSGISFCKLSSEHEAKLKNLTRLLEEEANN